MNYQKTYMNHIHSSSLLCQLSTMWKSQTLCDAVIRAGNNITRAHRVVLVAACPMLQSMENAAAGSHLEVRVASDIKQESIHTFLQYLYEGFMTLTEENCRDVEKVARLLQVDGVIKCCADFHKCMDSSSAGQYKYSLLDQIEFRHVRTTELAKCQERVSKRPSEGRHSPEGKRQRIQRPSSPPSNHSSTHKVHDMHSMSESYMPDVNAPWDRVPHVGAGAAPNRFGNQPGVIDIVEDSLELIQTEPPGKHPGDSNKDSRRIQQSVGISVASQHNTGADLQIVNVTGNSNQNVSNNPPRSISDNMNIDNSPSSSSSSSFKESSNRPTDRPGGPPPPQLQRMEPSRQPAHGTINLIDIPQSPEHDSNIGSRQSQARPSENFPTTSTPQRAAPFPVSLTAVPRGTANFQSKPFAAGSATQAEASSPRGQKPSALGGGEMASPIERAKETGNKGKQDITDSGPDISIVKVEHNSGNMASDSTGGLDMFVSEGMTVTTANQRATEEEEQSEYELEEPPGDMSHGDMSNDGAGDQSENWYMGNIKDMNFSMLNFDQNLANPKPRPGIWDAEEAFKLGMRELTPASSVFVYESEYLSALSKIKISEKTHKKDGTPAARYLLSVFYTSAELVNATIRNDGDDPTKPQGPYVPLNKTIIYAIEDFCAKLSSSSHTVIRNALWSKITAYRTHAKNKMKKIAQHGVSEDFYLKTKNSL